MTAPRGFEYRITYRRAGWLQAQPRYRQTRHAADRFAEKLASATTDSLKRTAGPGGGSSSEQLALPGLLADLAESGRISADAARQIALAVHALVELPSEQRSALVALVLSMAGNNET